MQWQQSAGGLGAWFICPYISLWCWGQLNPSPVSMSVMALRCNAGVGTCVCSHRQLNRASASRWLWEKQLSHLRGDLHVQVSYFGGQAYFTSSDTRVGALQGQKSLLSQRKATFLQHNAASEQKHGPFQRERRKQVFTHGSDKYCVYSREFRH